MMNRRQRLEFALNILPYSTQAVKLSAAQQQVEKIIARLRTDDSASESDEDPKVRRQHEADTFAEHTMRCIELSESGKLSTLATLTLAAEKLLKAQQTKENQQHQFEDTFIIDEQVAFAELDREQLMQNSIQAVNEARVKLLQGWERSKRKALDLLTLEIEKVQAKDQEADTKKTAHFELFRDGADDHNTSTPKTNDEDMEGLLDEDDEDYVPSENNSSNKRKRLPKPVTSTPNPKKPAPGFEFDQDPQSRLVVIGPNGTQISRYSLNAINWDMTGASITRKLLCEIFDRQTLAYHTLSGKPSPAFMDCARPSKQPLDPLKVADLVYLMTNSMNMTPREVRTAITTKCADENKMLRSRTQRRQRKSK